MKISKNSKGIGWEKENDINTDGGTVDLSSYAKKTDLSTKTSQLINDSGYITEVPSEYITETELNSKGYLTEHQDISGKADKSEIPTKVSDLANDSNFLTSIPLEYITESELNAKGYLTEVPSEYITEIELESKGYLTEHQDISGKANKSDIPTKTSQLTNDSNFLTSVPSEYVTETELNSKGYLTEHQDISGKLNAPTVSGKSNQMLLSDGQGGSYWVDIPGMEGGTVIFRTVNEGEIFTLEEGGGTTPNVTYGKIVTSVNALEVLEGESCTFTVKLDSAPTQNQVVTINSDIATVVPSPSNVTFTTSNYNTPVKITLNTSADEDSALTYCNITLSTNSGNKVLILQVKEPESSGGTEEPETPVAGMITEGLVHKYDYTNITSNIVEDTVGNDDLEIIGDYKLDTSYGSSLGYVQNNDDVGALFTKTSFAESLTSYTILMRVSPISVASPTTVLNAAILASSGNTQLVDWTSATLGMYMGGTSAKSSANQFTYGENQIIIGITVDGETFTESIIVNGRVVVTATGSQTYPCATAQPFGYEPKRNKFKYYECVVYNRVLSESELTSMCEYMLANKQ